MDCAWMLDGAMDNCVYALSLASRGQSSPSQTDSWLIRIDSILDFESTPSSRFHKLPRIESIQLVPEPIRFYPDFKINIQNALIIDSPSSESIPKSRNVVLKNEFSEE
ncbi:hypothetical protein PIB30_029926 [Stylosanthes scabra]|uniref:Uncharacterized protein n=1 Tax=Stylosanthes scabra TaxID=79078 RepID=A0ABU6UB90_9FABA|nr:hypothetical protein [Stylosanthes scabra]